MQPERRAGAEVQAMAQLGAAFRAVVDLVAVREDSSEGAAAREHRRWPPERVW